MNKDERIDALLEIFRERKPMKSFTLSEKAYLEVRNHLLKLKSHPDYNTVVRRDYPDPKWGWGLNPEHCGELLPGTTEKIKSNEEKNVSL
jgi:hypothetical protein